MEKKGKGRKAYYKNQIKRKNKEEKD